MVLDLLGKGSTATVYRVTDTANGLTRALKLLDVAGRDQIERLMNEAEVQTALRHDNVVEVFEFVDTGEHIGLLMEFIDGPTLGEIMERRQLTFEEIDNLGQGILRGVRAAHRHNTIHRDLKPANILLQHTEHGLVPKVCDFGLAKVLLRPSMGKSLTQSGQVMGSPPYMAPEQIRDSKGVDARADIFSLGGILYRMCTGKRPFDDDDVIHLFVAITVGEYPPPRELVPDIPDRMVKAIEMALVVDVDKRIQHVDHLLAVWLDRPIATSDMKTAQYGHQSRPPQPRRSKAPEIVRDLDRIGPGSLISVESMDQTEAPAPPLIPGKAWVFGLIVIGLAMAGAALALGIGLALR